MEQNARKAQGWSCQGIVVGLERGLDKPERFPYDLESEICFVCRDISRGQFPMEERLYFRGQFTAEQKKAFSRIVKKREKLNRTLEKLRRESEEMLKSTRSAENNVVFNTVIECKRGTLAAEFKMKGDGIVLKSGEEAEYRHAFARLLYDSSDSSCEVRICPAIIPGLDLSGSEIDAAMEKEQEDWRFLFGEILRRSGFKQIEVKFGDLLDIYYLSTSKQCHSAQ
jgi:hypothetical protein